MDCWRQRQEHFHEGEKACDSLASTRGAACRLTFELDTSNNSRAGTRLFTAGTGALIPRLSAHSGEGSAVTTTLLSPREANSRVAEEGPHLGPAHQSFHRRGLATRELSASELAAWQIPGEFIESIPESVARENLVCPLGEFGGRLMLVAADPDDLSTADKLRFILNRDVALVGAPREAVLAAINEHYSTVEGESADSVLQEFTDTALACLECESTRDMDPSERRSGAPLELADVDALVMPARVNCSYASYSGQSERGAGMFYQTVEEGQRMLMKRRDGTMEVLIGPRRVWRWWRSFEPLPHYVAHPGQYLDVRFRDGQQEHVVGPAELWFDSRVHQEIDVREALQLSAQEAVVVYSRPVADTGNKPAAAARRIVYGPGLFVPEPGEWLHTFSWHASQGGSRGVEKVPNALVFKKLWLMPDQMYHDVHDVRTADDAVLTIRLMIFFELVDISRMLDATHDPIGDFVNAATADVVEFTGRHEFEAFKRNTAALNDLATYRQLAGRAAQCGYRISNVVYRGYGAADSLQQMHDQAIEARTKLQLDRATEQQAQELEDFRLASQMTRAAKRRSEQTAEVRHDLALAAEKHDAELAIRQRQQAFQRQERLSDARQRDEIARATAAQEQDHYRTLKDLGVDLTAFLTQSRADRVIELRGSTPAHVHLDRLDTEPANGHAALAAS